MRKVTSVQDYFDSIQERFKPAEAAGVSAVVVYELDGAGVWTVRIKDQTLTVEPGSVEKADVTFKIKADDYVNLVNGDLNGAKAFLTRKLKVSGSIPMAQKMNKFLPPAS
jgi:putative sterol carrier protein